MWLTRFLDYLSKNWLHVIMLLFIILFVSWLFGYFYGAFYNIKFDLSSVWTGVAAITGAGVMGLGQKTIEYYKYKTDSVYNSRAGETPPDPNTMKKEG